MGKPADLYDADDVEPLVRVVEEAEIADLHGAHVVARRVVAYAVPFLAGLALLLEHVEGEGIRLRLEQPVLHRGAPAQTACGLLKVQFHCRISVEAKMPASA